MHVFRRDTSSGVELPESITRRDALKLALGASAALLASPKISLADEFEASQETLMALEEAQSQADAIQAQLESIGAEIQSLAGEYEVTLAQVEEINVRLWAKEDEIKETEEQIAKTEEEIASTEASIKQTQDEIELAQERLSNRMSRAYKSGTRGIIDLLLSSASFEEFTSNIYYLDKISASDEEMIAKIKELKAQLEDQKAELESQKAELESQKAELESQKAELESVKAELEGIKASQETQLANMQAKQAEVSALLSDANEQVADLLAQRDAEIYEAQQEAARIAAARAAAAANDTSWYAKPSVVSGATGSQQAVINASYTTPTAGSGWCAAWVTYVFMNAGIGTFTGNACDMYWWYCVSSDVSTIQPGMIIAVPSHPFTAAGAIYGHVGIYVGNGQVRHNIGNIATYSLDQWISSYNATTTPRWGWLGGVALA